MKKIILAASAAIVMFACSGDRVGSGTDVAETKAAAVQKEKIYGVAQKGPFVNGNVVIYELDDKYEKTKRTFKGKTNDKGYFEIEIKGGKLASPYVIIEAKGKYANEVSGRTTDNAITLKAVADISNKDNVNINVLTDLESDKVIKLAKEGKSFEDAKTQAQKEVFTSLGISESSATRNSEDMALFGGNSSDSVLLVVSVSLQGNRTEEQLSALLSDLSGSGKFDVEKGLKDANVDMGKVKDHILEIEPSAVVSIPTTPKTPTTNTTPNTSTSRPTTPSTSTPSYTPPTSYNPPAQSNPAPSTPAAQPAPTPVPPPVVIEKEKPICSKEITEDCVYKCGEWDYNPATDICKNGEVNKCGTEKYDPAKQFCTRSENNPKVVEKCGGKGYDTRTKECVEGVVKNILLECGTEKYDPATQVCENDIVKTLFTDARDGKVYKSVKIGEQEWMAENLNYAGENGFGKCYEDKEANCKIYGRLYNWKAAMAGMASSDANPSNVQGLCPDGWHMPRDAEWDVLMKFVNSNCVAGSNYCSDAGTKLKATSGWYYEKGNGTDDYGFAALPGGYANSTNPPSYSLINSETRFWSTYETGGGNNNAFYRGISHSSTDLSWAYTNKAYYYSVRCVKGQGTAPNPNSICGDRFITSEQFCYDKTVYSKCSGKEEYNPATQFCSSIGTSPSGRVYSKCGGEEYMPLAEFCLGTTIYTLCGGKEYDPSTESCSKGEVYKYSLCGTEKYNPATHFCTKSESNPKVAILCSGKGYDTRAKYCKDGTVQDITTFTDARDKKTYKYVEIGTQTWMAENLNYAAEGSKCGTDIIEGYDASALSSENTSICDTYGRLYDWSTAMKSCPVGWHLPDDSEWTVLTNFVGGATGAGNKLKAISGWNSVITGGGQATFGGNGQDTYGFAALPGGQGYKSLTSKPAADTFSALGENSLWWSATPINNTYANFWSVSYRDDNSSKASSVKTNVVSVRCLQD